MIATLVLALLVNLQAPEPEADFTRDLAALEKVLAVDGAGQRASPADRGEALATFLRVHGDAHRSAAGVLRARTELATWHLHEFAPQAALAEFDRVLADASPAQRDLVGRARYGRAQALEMLDRDAAAVAALQDLVDLHAGERYARFGRVALARLEGQRGTRGGWAPHPAPDFGPLADLDGKLHQAKDFAGELHALVFFSPAVADSVTRLTKISETWRRGGGEPTRLLALALGASPAEARSAVAAHDLRSPVVACGDEFLDPTALTYEVTRLPTMVVVGPDGRVLGRDPSLPELERILRLLR